MAWLSVNAGQTVTVRIVDGVLHERLTHWVDRTVKDCMGPGCAYCAAGAKPRSKWWLSCQVGGEDTTWEFPGAVLDQLNALLPSADRRAGAVISLTRHGEGLATRYAVSGAVGPGVGDVKVPSGDGLDHAGVVDVLLTALAAKIPPGSAAVWEVVEGVKGVLGSEEYLGMLGQVVVEFLELSLKGDKMWPGGIVGAIAAQIEDGLAESASSPSEEVKPDA